MWTHGGDCDAGQVIDGWERRKMNMCKAVRERENAELVRSHLAHAIWPKPAGSRQRVHKVSRPEHDVKRLMPCRTVRRCQGTMPAFPKLARELEDSALFVSYVVPPTVLGVKALRSVPLRCLRRKRTSAQKNEDVVVHSGGLSRSFARKR